MYKQRLAVLFFSALGIIGAFSPWLPVSYVRNRIAVVPWNWILLGPLAITLVVTALGNWKSGLGKVNYHVVRFMGLLVASIGIYNIMNFILKIRLFRYLLDTPNQHSFYSLNHKFIRIIEIMSYLGIGMYLAVISGMGIIILATVLKQECSDLGEHRTCGECRTCLLWQYMLVFGMRVLFILSIVVIFDILEVFAPRISIKLHSTMQGGLPDDVYLLSFISLGLLIIFSLLQVLAFTKNLKELRYPHLEKNDSRKYSLLLDKVIALVVLVAALLLPFSFTERQGVWYRGGLRVLYDLTLVGWIRFIACFVVVVYYIRGILVWAKRQAWFLYHFAVIRGWATCKGSKTQNEIEY